MRLGRGRAAAAPFVVIVIATLLGGVVNTTDARGRIVDDLTDDGVTGATITHGSRTTTTDAAGHFTLLNVPKTSKYQIDALGYLRTSAPVAVDEVRLKPLSFAVTVYDETKTPDDRVNDPQARDPRNTKILSTGNEAGQIFVAPHPGKDAPLLICGEGFEPKQIVAHGVSAQVGLKPGGTGCPPLPTPSPAPSPSGSPTPSPSPTASPAPSPSPTGP